MLARGVKRSRSDTPSEPSCVPSPTSPGSSNGGDAKDDVERWRAKMKSAPPVISYRVEEYTGHKYDASIYARARETMKMVDRVVVPPRDAKCFEVPAGHFFRIVSTEGPQVGDLNLWNRDNIKERFYTSKTRQLHGTHVKVGDRLWSSFPYMRPMATLVHDTLNWYGFDEHGGGLHDVIGSRCDPYTCSQLGKGNYNRCCHSNITRTLVARGVKDAESHVHDVLNVFMCTGFTKDTHKYFMKETPVRPGDFLEMFAEIPLLGSLSTCPGGDCSSSHSDDVTTCYPLIVEVYKPEDGTLDKWPGIPEVSAYSGNHGLPLVAS